MKSHIRKIIATTACIAGPLFVLISIVSLNHVFVDLGVNTGKSTTQFQVTQQKPKQQKKLKPKPRPKKNNKNKELQPNLDAIIAGSSFGLEMFAWLDKDALGGNLMADMRDAAMTADTVEQAPIIVHTAPLNYPQIAQKQGIKGYVTLNLLVAPNGNVEKTHIVASEPKGIFDAVATSSVKKWKFQPGMNKGHKVAVWVEQTIQFALN